ncbi:MAG: SRPBCC family protein [Gammaproteobacteria bacterium]|nr:SRPBCC family protein [Gammaproteobacteria bacterium]
MKIRFLVLLSVLMLPGLVYAHGPSRQKVAVERVVNVSPEEAWAVVGDFAALDKWLPPVEKCEIISGTPTEEGAVRKLTVGGKYLEETLKSLDPDTFQLKYRITEGDTSILPVSNYSSTISVKDDGNGGSVVSWKGAFYRGYPNNDPPPELNDKAAIEAVEGLYNLGLDNLKAMLESH